MNGSLIYAMSGVGCRTKRWFACFLSFYFKVDDTKAHDYRDGVEREELRKQEIESGNEQSEISGEGKRVGIVASKLKTDQDFTVTERKGGIWETHTEGTLWFLNE